MFEKEKKQKSEFELEVLITVVGPYEQSVIGGLLDSAGIPYVVKDRGTGNYMKIYTGSSYLGTDILVAKPMLEQATEAIAGIDFSKEDDTEV